ncbi:MULTISPECIES: hypothetical protein [Ramlibacter]|uniref:Uncharacterized protein n=1 Tax=Ramlibacter pinisoli TaxID=2682844 RepID=A0A6N8IS59_9BURK|nr:MULTISPECIES: hypothetical protein [Ramlibacter]MBA2964449.1 hypothetical protein [Ramlibacter sp. CGMCC 1.13660]MVQ29415.1 hypothetical protein [Ramlibacter pinisoli]
MEWISFENRTTIGQTGSESGVIVRDSEHPLGARITLEKDGSVAPYSITCGIYGCMVHTRFFSAEQEASQQFDLMAAELESILKDSGSGNDLLDPVGRFVEQFP